MKNIILGIFLLLVSAVWAVFWLPSAIDWNNYKGKITAQVEEITGRKLVIDGNIAFSVFPYPVLSVSKAKLMNVKGGTSEYMVSLDELNIHVALWPLLVGQIQMEKVFLVKPNIFLEELPDGELNWKLKFLKTDSKKAFQDFQVGTKKAVAAVQFDSVIIKDGTLVYKNSKLGIEKTFSNVNAEIIAKTLKGPFNIEGNVSYNKIPIGYKLSIGKLIPDGGTEVNIVISHLKTETIVTFGGVLSQLSAKQSLNGNLSIDIPKPIALASILFPESSLPPTLDIPFSLKSSADISPQMVKLNGCIIRFDNSLVQKGAQSTASGGLKFIPAAYSKTDKKEPHTVNATFKFNKLYLDQWADALIYISSNKSETKRESILELFSDFSGDINIEAIEAPYRKNVMRQVNLSLGFTGKNEILVNKASALAPGGSSIFVSGKLSSKNEKPYIDGSVNLTVDKMKDFIKWFSDFPLNISRKRSLASEIKFKITGTDEDLRISDFSAKIDKSNLEGEANISFGARPSIGLLLGVDDFNLDAYLPEDITDTEKKKHSRETSINEAFAQVFNKFSALFPKFSVLNDFDANVRSSFSSVTYGGIPMKDVGLDFSLLNGELNLNRAKVGETLGTRFSFKGGISGFGSVPQFKNFSYNFYGAKIGRLAHKLKIKLPVDAKYFTNVELIGEATGSPDKLEIDALSKTSGISIKTKGSIVKKENDFTYNLALEVRHNKFRSFVRLFNKKYRPAGKVLGILKATANITGDNKTVDFSDIDFSIGLHKIKGTAAFDFNKKRPQIKAKLTGNDLHISKFLQKKKEFAKKSNIAPWSKTPVDLSWFDLADIEMSLNAEKITYKSLEIEQPKLVFSITDRIAKIKKLTGEYNNGDLEGSGTIDSSGITHEIDGKITLFDSKVFSKLFDNNLINVDNGNLELNLEFSLSGQNVYEWITKADGNGEFIIKGGTLIGFSMEDISAELSKRRTPDNLHETLETFISSEKTTLMKKAKGEIAIDKGHIKALKNKINTDFGNINMSVAMDLKKWSVDSNLVLLFPKLEDIPNFSIKTQGNLSNLEKTYNIDELKEYFASLKQQDDEIAEAKAKAEKAAAIAKAAREAAVHDINGMLETANEIYNEITVFSKSAAISSTKAKTDAEFVPKAKVFVSAVEIHAKAAKAVLSVADFAVSDIKSVLEEAKNAKSAEEAKETVKKAEKAIERIQLALKDAKKIANAIKVTTEPISKIISKTITEITAKAEISSIKVSAAIDEIKTTAEQAMKVFTQASIDIQFVDDIEDAESQLDTFFKSVEKEASYADKSAKETKTAMVEIKKAKSIVSVRNAFKKIELSVKKTETNLVEIKNFFNSIKTFAKIIYNVRAKKETEEGLKNETKIKKETSRHQENADDDNDYYYEEYEEDEEHEQEGLIKTHKGIYKY